MDFVDSVDVTARGASLVGVFISLQCGKPESKLSQYPTISGLLYLIPNRIIAYHGLPYFFLSQNDVEMIQCHFPIFWNCLKSLSIVNPMGIPVVDA